MPKPFIVFEPGHVDLSDHIPYLLKLIAATLIGGMAAWQLLIRYLDPLLFSSYGRFLWYGDFIDVVNLLGIDVIGGLFLVAAVQVFHPKA